MFTQLDFLYFTNISESKCCLIHRVINRGEVEDTKKSESEAKDSPSEDRPSRGQGPRTQAQVFSKKRSSKFFFRRSPKNKSSSKIFFRCSPKRKKTLQNFFQAIYKILNIQKIVLSSRTGQFSRI